MRPITIDGAENAVNNLKRDDMNDLEIVCDANNLWDAFYNSKKGVSWKESVQRYEANLLMNIFDTHQNILADKYKPKRLSEFDLHERGRIRHIKAQHISDRIIQRSLDDYVLLPRVTPNLIYDNYASLKRRGAGLARKRFELFLKEAYRNWGDDTYLLFIDFSKYFDNIRHDVMLNQLAEFVDQQLLNFIRINVFKPFEVDVSYMSDDEYNKCTAAIFNAVEYYKLSPELRSGQKFMKKSIGIGNPTAQICGILHPFHIDNYCKIVKGFKYYGRYMDDIYIISKDKELLKNTAVEIGRMCADLGIFINHKKTRINKISCWNTFLKINYKVLPNGKLVRKIANSTIRRERRRLQKYKRLLICNKMPFGDILNSFASWLGMYKKYNSGYKILKLKTYFNNIFQKELTTWKQNPANARKSRKEFAI